MSSPFHPPSSPSPFSPPPPSPHLPPYPPDAAPAPPPSGPPSDDSLALGLGLGLGIGIPALLLIGYLAWAYMTAPPGKLYNWTPWKSMGIGAAAAGGVATAMIPSATVDMGVPQKGGEPGVYAVVSGNRWFWSAAAAK